MLFWVVFSFFSFTITIFLSFGLLLVAPQSTRLSSVQLVLHSTAHFSRNLKAVPSGQLICAVIDRICNSKPAYHYRRKNNQALNCPESNVSCLSISDTHFTESSLTFKYRTRYTCQVELKTARASLVMCGGLFCSVLYFTDTLYSLRS